MRISNRSFDEAKNDYLQMWNFIIQDITDKKDQFIWQPGRLGDSIP